MCLDDGTAASRLAQRKTRIATEMFPNLLTLEWTANPDDLVWVDTAQLVQYVSCSDRMNDLLDGRSGRTLLQHHELLCSHEPPGLHPRVARQGKLLPRSVYETYVAGLRQEQKSILGRDTDESAATDCLILLTDNLVCVECSRDYQAELGQKLNRVKAMKKLYDLLDPKELDCFKFEFGLGDTFGHERDNYAYILSRRFITAFRNQISALMKSAAAAVSVENVNEGLDAFDLSSFEKKTLDKDLCVPNSNITCKTPQRSSFYSV
jgi:hypothetical protein